MTNYAGIDVSLETSSVCIVDAQGVIQRELKTASEPDAMVAALLNTGLPFARIGLEAGRCRSGSMQAWPRPGCRWCFSRPGSCAPPPRPCRSRPTGTTHGPWLRWCAPASTVC